MAHRAQSQHQSVQGSGPRGERPGIRSSELARPSKSSVRMLRLAQFSTTDRVAAIASELAATPNAAFASRPRMSTAPGKAALERRWWPSRRSTGKRFSLASAAGRATENRHKPPWSAWVTTRRLLNLALCYPKMPASSSQPDIVLIPTKGKCMVPFYLARRTAACEALPRSRLEEK